MMAMDDGSIMVYDFIKQMSQDELKGVIDDDGAELTCMHSIDLSSNEDINKSAGSQFNDQSGPK